MQEMAAHNQIVFVPLGSLNLCMFFFSIDGDFRERHTLWTQSFGAFFTYVSFVGANQAIVQRYITVKKLWHAQV